MVIIATPAARVDQRRYGAGALFALPEGTLDNTVDPTVTDGKLVLDDASGGFPGDKALLLGVTTEGTTFTSGIDTEDDEAAEYYYPINTLVTGQTCSLSMELKQINISNLMLALNAGADPPTAEPSATALTRFSAPLPGDEKYVQIVWVSQDESMAIILYRALQTNELSVNFTKGADTAHLDLEFTGLLPGTSIADTPFDILVAGDSYKSTTPGIDDLV